MRPWCLAMLVWSVEHQTAKAGNEKLEYESTPTIRSMLYEKILETNVGAWPAKPKSTRPRDSLAAARSLSCLAALTLEVLAPSLKVDQVLHASSAAD